MVKPKLNPTILNCHVEFFGKSSGTNTLNNLWYILLKIIASKATKMQRKTIEARILTLQISEMHFCREQKVKGGNADSFPIFLGQSDLESCLSVLLKIHRKFLNRKKHKSPRSYPNIAAITKQNPV